MLHQNAFEVGTKGILPDLAHERRAAAQLAVHCQHVGGCSAGVAGKPGNALFSGAAGGKVDEDLAQTYKVEHPSASFRSRSCATMR